MKQLFIVFAFALAGTAAIGQQLLRPPSIKPKKKWLSSRVKEYDWLLLRDTVRTKMATVRVEWLVQPQLLTVVTQVVMKNSHQPWVDTTIALLPSLAPVRHSSYNAQREMVLNFGTQVTGFYKDKMRQRNLQVKDSLSQLCFDSNLYPVVLGWLKLKPGYADSLAIYDYNPAGKSGVLKAFVTQVEKGVYQTDKMGERAVWLVTAQDQLGNGQNAVSTYYFDVATRQLWRQDIVAGKQRMIMKLIEP